MNKRDVSITMEEAAPKSLIIILPLMAIQTTAFFLLHDFSLPRQAEANLFAVVLLLGLPAHELIHLFAWLITTRKPLSAFKLGFYWKALTPYAHCKETMDIRAYRIGSVTPALLLGLLPWLVSLFNGDILLFLFGLLYTTAAGGDLLILWLLRGVKPGTLVEDHPTNAGCFVIEP